MVTVMEYKDDFYEIYNREKRMVIAYGAGEEFRKNFDKLPDIDLICDRDAANIIEFHGIKVVKPEQLQAIDEPIYVIVCIKDSNVYQEVCAVLKEFLVDAMICHYCNNIAFDYAFFDSAVSYCVSNEHKRLAVNIVCRDSGWIFTKFADRLCENLSVQDVDVTLSRDTNPIADVNHHIPFAAYKPYKNDTLMITHVNVEKVLLLLQKQLKTAGLGICMSEDTMKKLVSYGVPRSKLCYINPAHDNAIRPKKYVIGILHRCYDALDVRKRATAVLDILEGINPVFFKFVIMGSGWEKIIAKMEEQGFETEYYPEFKYDTYNALVQKLDYLLYMGFDEGSMSYQDAMAAGVGTIVTPQGFHLDSGCSIDYPCSTVMQFNEAFRDLQRMREKRIRSVANWTWQQYALKHLEVWNYLLRRKSLSELYRNQSFYMDGIFSVLIEDDRIG